MTIVRAGVSAVRRRVRGEAGMATVELAAALPVLVLMMLVGVTAVRVADVRARCIDGARETARAAARGDPRATALGHRAAGAQARIGIATTADRITATVRLVVHPLGGSVGTITVTEQAVAAVEPDDDDGSDP